MPRWIRSDPRARLFQVVSRRRASTFREKPSLAVAESIRELDSSQSMAGGLTRIYRRRSRWLPPPLVPEGSPVKNPKNPDIAIFIPVIRSEIPDIFSRELFEKSLRHGDFFQSRRARNDPKSPNSL